MRSGRSDLPSNAKLADPTAVQFDHDRAPFVFLYSFQCTFDGLDIARPCLYICPVYSHNLVPLFEAQLTEKREVGDNGITTWEVVIVSTSISGIKVLLKDGCNTREYLNDCIIG